MHPAAESNQIDLAIRGMHCAGCVGTVEKALRKVPGVVDASVNLATERATVRLAPTALPTAGEALASAVRSAGYEAILPTADSPSHHDGAHDHADREPRKQLRGLLIAAVLGLPVVAFHMLPPLMGEAGHRFHHLSMTPIALWIQAALTTACIAAGAGSILLSALRAALHGNANMDVLVSLGMLAALGSSIWGAVRNDPTLIFFEAAVMIVLFVGLGKLLEARARRAASSALRAIMGRLPRTVLRVVNDQTESVPIDAVARGDIVRIPVHATIPVDGTVTSGTASVDESMLTGESVPLAKGVGATVFAGTAVLEGLIDVRADATGAASTAARIAEMVADAQAAKPPWQRFADRVAGVFVPVVLVLAGLTFVGWITLGGASAAWALERAIAVLVVACPCALGLAVPTAVLVGTTRAASEGILVRDATALEAAGHVRIVFLDKTGTLTLGRPDLQKIERLGAGGIITEDMILRYAAGLAALSEHPLAKALVNAARQRKLRIPAAIDFVSKPGLGLSGSVGGTPVAFGSADWLKSMAIATESAVPRADALAADGASVVWLAVDGQVVALLAFVDQLHPEAPAAIARLRALRVEPRILSGDRLPAVRHVAQQLGITGFEGQLTPADKLARVQAAVQSSQRVAMVGDGVNDAPALAAADVGIAIGTGADVARSAADICLVGHSPRLIAAAIEISRRSGRIMLQNLAWAGGYNLVMLPLAIFSPLSPALATGAMMLSSLSVVGNSLRLRRHDPA